VALVPLSLFMAIAWIVVSFLPALSPFIMLFALLVAFCYFAEALTGQYDFAVGVGLYTIPLMLTVALLATALFLWALFSVTRADEIAKQQTVNVESLSLLGKQEAMKRTSCFPGLLRNERSRWRYVEKS